MSTYIYNSPNVTSFKALYDELKSMGVTDSQISLNGKLSITTEIGSESDCDAAVTNVAPGTLTSNKSIRLKELSYKSSSLAEEGLSHEVSGSVGLFPIDQTRFDFSYYQSIVVAVTNDPSLLPFTLETVGGGMVQLSTLDEVKNLAAAVTNRIIYIYLEQTNSDASKGEIGYIIDIKTAQTQAALDAIVDTRV